VSIERPVPERPKRRGEGGSQTRPVSLRTRRDRTDRRAEVELVLDDRDTLARAWPDQKEPLDQVVARVPEFEDVQSDEGLAVLLDVQELFLQVTGKLPVVGTALDDLGEALQTDKEDTMRICDAFFSRRRNERQRDERDPRPKPPSVETPGRGGSPTNGTP